MLVQYRVKLMKNSIELADTIEFHQNTTILALGETFLYVTLMLLSKVSKSESLACVPKLSFV